MENRRYYSKVRPLIQLMEQVHLLLMVQKLSITYAYLQDNRINRYSNMEQVLTSNK